MENDQKICTREISNLRRLEHGSIVSFYGYALPCPATEGHFVIFTEYISGGSLSDLIESMKTTNVDPTTMAIIVVGIVLGMKYVHSLGIMHRDLKPSNVLLDEHRRPYICDFGSSRVLLPDVTLTSSQFTVYYVAPESGEETLRYDTKVDVYSFAILLYELVTGTFALRHMNPVQVMRFILSGKRPEIPDTVLPFTRRLIERCWVTDPSDRPSFAEIYDALVAERFRLFNDVNFEAVSSYADSLLWWESDLPNRT